MHNRIAGHLAGVRERDEARFQVFRSRGRWWVMNMNSYLSRPYDSEADARAAAAEWELLRSLGLPTPRLGGREG